MKGSASDDAGNDSMIEEVLGLSEVLDILLPMFWTSHSDSGHHTISSSLFPTLSEF